MTIKKNASKTTKSAKTKRRTGVKRQKLPERNIFMERMIIVCAVALILFTIIVTPGSLLPIAMAMAMFVNQVSGMILGLVVGLVLLSFLLQALLVLRQWQRVDRYMERLGALLAILSVPIIMGLVAVIQIGLYILGIGVDEYRGIVMIFAYLYPIGLIAGLIGTVYLWSILLSKEKYFWVYTK